MKRKPIVYTHENKVFHVYVVPNCGGGLCDVHIYEYLPKAKLFKERYRDTFSMWVQDYPTIEEGARSKLAKFLNEDAERMEIAKKWEEFYNKY